MEEIWQNIEGFEYYQASNLGQIKSLGRVVNCNGGKKTVKEKILKPIIQTTGYKTVNLYKNGKPNVLYVHRLVYEAFCGKIPDGYVVNHINEVKTDNRLENLNLMTPKENTNYGTGIERRSKAQLNHPRMSKPVVGMDEQGNIVASFPSTAEAGRNGYNQSHVAACCRGVKPSHKGLIWKFMIQ